MTLRKTSNSRRSVQSIMIIYNYPLSVPPPPPPPLTFERVKINKWASGHVYDQRRWFSVCQKYSPYVNSKIGGIGAVVGGGGYNNKTLLNRKTSVISFSRYSWKNKNSNN